MEVMKLLACHLEDLRVPLMVRVPQVGNPCPNTFCQKVHPYFCQKVGTTVSARKLELQYLPESWNYSIKFNSAQTKSYRTLPTIVYLGTDLVDKSCQLPL